MSARDTDPEDVDATFAAIVADLRAEGVGQLDEDTPGEPVTGKAAEPEASWRTGGTGWDATMLGDDPGPDTDDDHYVPPEPPPLPRPGKGAIVVALFFLVGLFMLLAPALIGVSATVGTPLGILSLATAIALLLLRVKQGPHDGDGAQV
ncbi:MAG TPA: hypothetical protein VJT49_26580 [Amycolatopsis sp.]|uniref:hypothetical protein n=1 Tax=Amycolatopsis sp. TaxID=37632 RepID=UPI002B492555|nr:hypothetical protein [Amycolatopsis sp.]HKS48614.1 hypothetical protein [Amycolatopsis sp.]